MTAKVCDLAAIQTINDEFFILHFNWENDPPRAGQFFMMKSMQSAVLLQRPISIFEYNKEQNILKFLIAKRGRGTIELSQLKSGDKVFLTGPLGNAWTDFLPESGKAALVGGSVGIAPLAALVAEKPDFDFHFYAGFREGFWNKDEENAFLGQGVNAKKVVIAAEDGIKALTGRITDFLDQSENYDVVFGCGPSQMLYVLQKKRETKKGACFVSLESRFACGVGACLGCSIKTVNGNRCCCKHGPIFPAGDVFFDE